MNHNPLLRYNQPEGCRYQHIRLSVVVCLKEQKNSSWLVDLEMGSYPQMSNYRHIRYAQFYPNMSNPNQQYNNTKTTQI